MKPRKVVHVFDRNGIEDENRRKSDFNSLKLLS
jgi:hypothetical protein